MIPVKIQCGCGQKYAFDAEPVNGQMASPVACPVCGVDGTPAANQIISQTLAAQAPPPPPVTRLRTAAAAPVASADLILPPIAPAIKPAAPKIAGEYSLGRGILGAVMGAVAGIAAMFAFYHFVGIRFPLLGVGIGVLTGFGAKLLARGTGSTLGYISGAIALVSVVGTLFLMYGTFPIVSIISVAVSASMAYRISS
jgi:hypothetical protein